MFDWFRKKTLGEGASRAWLNANFVYEGFPIYFRRLAISVDEYSLLSSQYSMRVTVTQHLLNVKKNGLPETDYNESLADFDRSLINIFHAKDTGMAVLIETFAGRRTYYFYVKPDFNAEPSLSEFSKHFHAETIEWKTDQDLDWGLLKKYARDFSFN